MKQGTIRIALSVFAFGLALSAVAAPTNPCQICEDNYTRCMTGTDTSKCWSVYLGCMRRGDGQHPCPL